MRLNHGSKRHLYAPAVATILMISSSGKTRKKERKAEKMSLPRYILPANTLGTLAYFLLFAVMAWRGEQGRLTPKAIFRNSNATGGDKPSEGKLAPENVQ